MALMNTRSSVAARPCRIAMRPAVRPVKAQALFNFGGAKTAESTSEFYKFQIKVCWLFVVTSDRHRLRTKQACGPNAIGDLCVSFATF